MQTTTTTIISNGYTTTTTQTVVKPDIYNDKGCNSNRNCKTYSAVADCILDLYNGINTCQNVYLFDKDGQLLDTDRLEYVNISLSNEHECVVMDTTSSDGGLYVSFLQETYDGELFEITPDNYYDMYEKFFDTFNVSIYNTSGSVCPDPENAIVLGNIEGETCVTFGQIIFNPISYMKNLYIEVNSAENNVGYCTCFVNGIPQNIEFNNKTEIINVLDDCDTAVVSVSSFGPEFIQTITSIEKIKFYTTKGFKNKGMIKLCYDGNFIPKIPGALTATIILKFKDSDKEEKGALHVISCVPVANVKRTF